RTPKNLIDMALATGRINGAEQANLTELTENLEVRVMRGRLFVAARSLVLIAGSVTSCGEFAVAEPSGSPTSASSSQATTSQPPADADSPTKLVDRALVAPSAAERKDLLERALALDPNCAQARWQLGYVHWHGEWLTPAQVAVRASEDKQLAAYRQKR